MTQMDAEPEGAGALGPRAPAEQGRDCSRTAALLSPGKGGRPCPRLGAVPEAQRCRPVPVPPLQPGRPRRGPAALWRPGGPAHVRGWSAGPSLHLRPAHPLPPCALPGELHVLGSIARSLRALVFGFYLQRGQARAGPRALRCAGLAAAGGFCPSPGPRLTHAEAPVTESSGLAVKVAPSQSPSSASLCGQPTG